ncbi:hypothetical protein [Streptomyces lydicus]|uniref:hypothetical protein n=1 Tax=Streptomyces lydicus TaxID=47763 RepID=UPI0037B26BC0
MGMDITVLIVEWAHLMHVAPENRLDVLQESAYSDEDVDSDAIHAGWIWPAEPERRWLGRYEFEGTLGSYKPHFHAANAWDAVRESVPPTPRAAVDGFLAGLIWWGPDLEAEGEHIDDGIFPSFDALWRPGPVIVRSPEAVTGLLDTWQQAKPLLSQLREPYQRVLAPSPESGRPPADFNGFAQLLAEWARVIDKAYRYGWGVVGLPI